MHKIVLQYLKTMNRQKNKSLSNPLQMDFEDNQKSNTLRLPNLFKQNQGKKVEESPKSKLKMKKVRQKIMSYQDDHFEDEQFQQKINKPQQKYHDLWMQLSKIHNKNEILQSKQIMSKTQPIQKELQSKKSEIQERIKALQEKIKDSYNKSHEIYQKLYQKQQINRKIQIHRKQQFKILRNEHKSMLSIEIAQMLNQNVNLNASNKQIEILKQQISKINNTIESDHDKIKLLKRQHKQIKHNLCNFLKQSLRHGYDYRFQGVKWIIKYLHKLNCQVNNEDLPEILDSKSKTVLLAISDTRISIQKHSIRDQLPMIKERRASFANSLSKDQINSAETLPVKKIYFKAKDYLNELIKNRQNSLNKHPEYYKESSRASLNTHEKQFNNERKRIELSYPKQIQPRILKIMFGINKSLLEQNGFFDLTQ